ncbi:MAG: thioredoxin [Bacteroidaceae bacterium]|nr:thioredoxin [Bacteroidaceae bacterium]
MEITDSNYQSVLAEGKPVMLDFWATWCGPCKIIAPIVEELAKEYEGKVIIGKVNVEENEELTEQFKVRNIPSLFFIKDGNIVDKFVGATTKDVIEAKINALL